jgi:arginine exporter protein ArgO
MKIRKYIYLVLAILCISLDILLTIADIDTLTNVATSEEYTLIEKLAYWAGFQVLLLVGILFCIGVYRVQKKIDRKNRQELLDAFTD